MVTNSMNGSAAAVRLPVGSASGGGSVCWGGSTGSSSPSPAQAAYSADTSRRHQEQAVHTQVGQVNHSLQWLQESNVSH